MIPGLEIFKEYFRDYKDHYVLIGGSALDIVLENTGIEARVTKDFDIVLIAEALTPGFGKQFWKFINDGNYKNKARSDGTPQYFRFESPEEQNFPTMIEILSRTENVLGTSGHTFIRIPITDSISSLSAILLDQEYYSLVASGKTIRDDIAILEPQYLLLLKIKAWLNLCEKKEKGEHVNKHDISKHITDVIRLTVILPGDVKYEIADGIKKDVDEFVVKYKASPIDPRSMGIKGVSIDDIASVLSGLYFG